MLKVANAASGRGLICIHETGWPGCFIVLVRRGSRLLSRRETLSLHTVRRSPRGNYSRILQFRADGQVFLIAVRRQCSTACLAGRMLGQSAGL